MVLEAQQRSAICTSVCCVYSAKSTSNSIVVSWIKLTLCLLDNPDVVNDYFVKVASKDAYDSRELDGFRCEANSDSYQPLYNFEVEKILSKIELLPLDVTIYRHGFSGAVLMNLLILWLLYLIVLLALVKFPAAVLMQ